MKSNKNGVKLLAAIAVFAMVFAGCAIVAVSDNSDAVEIDNKLSFRTTVNYDSYGETSNSSMKNSLTIYYDKTVGKYTFYGFLAEQNLDDKTSAFYKMWTSNTDYKYGISFTVPSADGDKLKVGNGKEITATDNTGFSCLLYIDDPASKKTVNVIYTPSGGSAITYVLDISNLKTISIEELSKKDIISFDENKDVTIDLKKDSYMIDPVTKTSGSVIINLNGYNLLTGRNIVNIPSNTTYATTNVTINAGNGGSITSEGRILFAYSDGKLTVNGGTYNAPNDFAFVWYGNTNGGKDTVVGEGAYFNSINVNADVGLWLSNGAVKEAVIKNSTITTKGMSIYLGTYQKATIDNCTISSVTDTAVEIKAGAVEIIGGSITSSNYVKADGTVKNDGSGSAVSSLVINNGYAGIADVATNVKVIGTDINNTKKDSFPISITAATGLTGEIRNITFETDSQEITEIEICKKGDVSVSVKASESKESDVIAGQPTDSGTISIDTIFIFEDNANANISVTVGKTVTMVTGSKTYTGTISLGNNSKVKMENVSGTFTVKEGSIYVIGDIIAGEITLRANDVLELNGNITNATIKFSGEDTEFATVTIKDGDKLNLTGTLTLESRIKMANDGEIVGGGTIVVPEGAQFYTSNPVSVSFTGAGKIILEDAMETLRLSDKLASSLTTEPTQKVIIVGNLTIKSGQTLRIQGDLEIPEGVTVTIENEGYLIIDGPTATADVSGTIKAVGQFSVISTGNDGITVDGTISVEGSNSIVINSITNLNGTISVSSKGTATFTSGLYVNETGVVEVKGTVSGYIYNMGTVTINGSVDSATIYMRSVDAVVNIEAVKSGTLTVSDSGLYLKTVDTYKKYVGGTSTAAPSWTISVNSVQFTNVKGITVTEGIKYKTVNDERNPYNYMYIAGSTGIADVKNITAPNAPSITVSTGKITVSDELTISKIALIVSSGATLSISGKVTVTDDDGTTLTGESATAKISVSGQIRTIDYEIDAESNVSMSAVKYSKKVDVKTEYYYTNLADAIASGDKDLVVLGELSILKDTTIPNGISIDASNSNVKIGSEDNKTVMLIVADGGYLESKTVNVIGTFYIENTETGVNRLSNITSDTSVITEKTAMYTNLANALNNAETGEVRITKTGDGKVSLKENATVKTDVTLIIPNSNTLSIMNGVVLTVDGTLDNKGTITSEAAPNATKNGFGPAVKKTNATGTDAEKLYSVITVTGTVISSTELAYGADFTSGYNIVGAYYEAKSRHYITTVDQAAESILSADDYKVQIYGKNKVGTVAFNGTVDKPVIVNVYGDISADLMTVKFGQMTFMTNNMKINGSFGSSVGTIEVSNIKVDTSGDVKLIITDSVVTIDEKDVQKAIITGSIKTADTKIVPSVIFNGDVDISTADLAIDVGCDVSGIKYGLISIDSNATVTVSKNNVDLDVKQALTVNGTLITTKDGNVKADVIEVLGTLDITKKTDKAAAGKIAVDKLYIGGSVKSVNFVTSATAAVNAPATGTKSVYLFPGSTVTGELKTVMDGEDAKYTEFYVEEALWLTVYAIEGNLKIADDSSGSTVYNFIPKEIEEKKFISWQYDYNGEMKNVEANTMIGSLKSVTANIQYEVYKVFLSVCEGIDNVYIDGVLAVADGYSDQRAYVLVNAGEHTVSYTLSNGYSGEATMLVNDKKVTGYKFTASGDFDKTSYKIILQGIEKSGYVPESPDVPAPVEPTEKDDSLGITEYLLIVLVVLAAILVVVVAIRMMRS